MTNTNNKEIINWVTNFQVNNEINSKIWGEYFSYEYCGVYNYINDIHFFNGKKNQLNECNDHFYDLYNEYIKEHQLLNNQVLQFDNLIDFAENFYQNNDLDFVKEQIKNSIIASNNYENNADYQIIKQIFSKPEKYKVNVILANKIVSNLIFGWFAPEGIYSVGYYVDKTKELYQPIDEIIFQIRPIYVLHNNKVNISIRIRLYFPNELLKNEQ